MNYSSALLVLFLLPAVHAEELVRPVTDADTALTVTPVPGQRIYPLIELTEPDLDSPVYALKGMIRYEDVEGDAFLQMHNDFGERGTFFTKSLAPSGPLRAISGSSDWRPFVLPFFATSGEASDGTALVPEKISLSLYLPGSGTVSVSDIGLYQYAVGEDPLRLSGQWFSDRNAGLFGGIAGALVGVWGALIGILSARGQARHFVLGSANALFVIGIASLAAGGFALAIGQPYAVYYPLLLIGIILVVVMGKMRGSLSARYEQLELKRMQSMDA